MGEGHPGKEGTSPEAHDLPRRVLWSSRIPRAFVDIGPRAGFGGVTGTQVGCRSVLIEGWQFRYCDRWGVVVMAKKSLTETISIYIPRKKRAERLVERLIELADKRDRSVNYLVVEATLEYLRREEGKP